MGISHGAYSDFTNFICTYLCVCVCVYCYAILCKHYHHQDAEMFHKHKAPPRYPSLDQFSHQGWDLAHKLQLALILG